MSAATSLAANAGQYSEAEKYTPNNTDEAELGWSLAADLSVERLAQSRV